MAQMFCTLKQAADKLETTEAQIEVMLTSGILREFRDGPRRLLKVADLADVAVAAHAADSRGVGHKTTMPQAEIDYEEFTLPEPEFKLPSAAKVIARMSHPQAATPKRTPRPAPKPIPRPVAQRRVTHAAVVHKSTAVARKPAAVQRHRNPPRAVVISPPPAPQRPRPQTHEMSLRQWLWTGLVDDSPIAIFIVFGVVLLGAAAAAGAVYLLTQAL
jgi:hypothetical protein